MKKQKPAPVPAMIEDPQEIQKTPMMLIHEITRLMGDKIRERGDENPIQQRSGRLILMELARKDGRTQLDLVKATHLKAPTISVALQKMEKDGYVRREPDEFDLRATRVYLTEQGKAIDDRIRKRICEEEALAVRRLTEHEYKTLVKLLTKVKNNILEDNRGGNFR